MLAKGKNISSKSLITLISVRRNADKQMNKTCTLVFKSAAVPGWTFNECQHSRKPIDVRCKQRPSIIMQEANQILSSREYFEALIKAFPGIEETLWDWDKKENLTHYNMDRFADYTITQIKLSNWAKVQECFFFQENVIESLNPELKNALLVCYCESLLLGEADNEMVTAINYMGPLLKKEYLEYEKYYNDLETGNK